MARSRLDLDAIFRTITPNVYFQPPENLKMAYPCIVYERDDANTSYADNSPYRRTQRYQVTVIDSDPESALRPGVADLPLCSFQQFFVTDNLNHDVFNIFF